jgi:hypothetical protein
MIEEKPLDLHRKEHYHEDSDKEDDFSEDELFKFKTTKSMLKLRWKSMKTATIQNAGGTVTASMKCKFKGKSRAAAEEADEYASQSAVNVDTLLKKVHYKLQYGQEKDAKLEKFTTPHGNWIDYNRKWSCDNFEISYAAIPGVDEVFVESKAGDFSENILMAFAVAYFMHPADNLPKLETGLMNEGRNQLGLL